MGLKKDVPDVGDIVRRHLETARKMGVTVRCPKLGYSPLAERPAQVIDELLKLILTPDNLGPTTWLRVIYTINHGMELYFSLRVRPCLAWAVDTREIEAEVSRLAGQLQTMGEDTPVLFSLRIPLLAIQ